MLELGLITAPAQLDVQIGTLHLLDRVEWDLSSPLTPELFALTLVRDLSLSSSASPLIAHALHEELFRQKKLCLEMGLVGEDASVAESVAGRKRGAKQLEGVWRDWPETMSFGPRVEVLSLDEMDRVEADRERAIRCVWVWHARCSRVADVHELLQACQEGSADWFADRGAEAVRLEPAASLGLFARRCSRRPGRRSRAIQYP